jgi:hypothetical protein
MNSKRKSHQLVKITKTLSGKKLDEPRYIEKKGLQHNHGKARPQHFDARRAGWVPGKNKKGKPCKVWVEDRRVQNERPE